MKEIAKGLILLFAGFSLGFGVFAGAGIAQRRARNAVFLAEAAADLGRIRLAAAAYKKARGRWPSGAGELYQAGLLDPSQPPYETLRGSGRWSGSWDGAGGFQYLSATGQAWLNTDLRRQKFSASDWARIRRDELVPPETLN